MCECVELRQPHFHRTGSAFLGYANSCTFPFAYTYTFTSSYKFLFTITIAIGITITIGNRQSATKLKTKLATKLFLNPVPSTAAPTPRLPPRHDAKDEGGDHAETDHHGMGDSGDRLGRSAGAALLGGLLAMRR